MKPKEGLDRKPSLTGWIEALKPRVLTRNLAEMQVLDPKPLDLAPKMKGFDPKPLKTAGFGPLAGHLETTTPLRIKYTYDI